MTGLARSLAATWLSVLIGLLSARGVPAQDSATWTWVVFSSRSLEEARLVHESYSALEMPSVLVSGSVRGIPSYRVTVGRFASSLEAKKRRSLLPDSAPPDTWLLRMEESTTVVPEAMGVATQEQTASAADTAVADRVATEVIRSRTEPPVPEAAYAQLPLSEPDPESDGESSSVGNRIHVQMRISNFYNSNIDHDEVNLRSYGVVPSLRLRFQDQSVDPVLTLDYGTANHSYTNTDRWDRLSHTARGEYSPELTDRLRTETVAEVSLKGSSEDRDLSDQYLLTQQVEYRATQSNRLQFYGTLRWKRFADNSQSNTFKPHVGVRLENRFAGNRRWELGVRYEVNRAQTSTRNYTRWTVDTEARFPVFGPSGRIEFGLKFRQKNYDERFVVEDVRRLDRRWIADATWRHSLGQGLFLELEYQFETRDSNDPDKIFGAHLVGFALTYDI